MSITERGFPYSYFSFCLQTYLRIATVGFQPFKIQYSRRK